VTNEATLLATIEELNDIVAADGAVLRVLSSDEHSVRLDLDLSQSECPECVVPHGLLLEIVSTRLAEVCPDVNDVSLYDPREDDGADA
jgi:hypothetical protein